MKKYTLKIDGMMCSMCEAHINNVIRKSFPVKKVSSSHSKGLTEIITEEDISQDDLKAAIDQTGYTFVSMTTEPYEKRGLFHRG